MDVLVAHNQTLLGKDVANVTAWSNFTTDPAFLTAFADQLRSDYAANVISHLSTSWQLNDITVSFIDTDHISHSVVVPFTTGPVVGTAPGDEVATQTALLISTSYSGARPNRGRVYFPGLTESSMTNSQWTFAVADDFRNMVLGWATGMATGLGTVFLRIMRRPSPVFINYVSSPVQNAVVRSFPATQRRRRLSV